MSIKRFINEGSLFHYFQPIYNLNSWKKIGYEALIRSSTHPNPESIFQLAKENDQLYDLDSHSIHKAISTYNSARLSRLEDKALFLNILPSTIVNQKFISFLEQSMLKHKCTSQQIVLEISESETIKDFVSFKKRLGKIKNQGFLIAIDDVGKGFSDIRSMIELEADYLKLDRYFSQDLHLSKQKQFFVSFFADYCQQSKSQLILEGVENPAEMETAKAMGVPNAQGYFLGKPNLLKEWKCE